MSEHVTRVARVFRSGAWIVAARCSCGWQRPAKSHAAAEQLADEHRERQ